MKRTLLVACALVMLLGAACDSPEPNQPPTAYITSISLAEVTEGDTVAFVGHGTDVDGEVVGYRWHSDLDGELSRMPTFEIDSLSVGEHTITFRVQDNHDAWSVEVQGTVKVRAPVAAPATIHSFAASLASITAGDNVMLFWNASNAETVTIDQGIGTVPAIGSVVVTPDETTTYRLTATGGGVTAAANVTVTVQRPVKTVVLTPEMEISGFIRSSGGVTPGGDIYVGDDDANRGVRSYLTYDISRIPADATITRVIVDLSGYETPYEPPFPVLGCLSAFEHPYNTLHGEYLMPGLPGAIETWCDFDELDTPTDSIGFRNALQKRVGEYSFQFRLQFADMETDGDGQRDLLHWPRARVPKLTVEYYLDEH